MEVVNTTSTTDPINMYNKLNSYVMNPLVFLTLILVIVSYYVFSGSLGNGNGTGESSQTTNSGSLSNIMATIIVIVLIILILINAFQYFFSINVTAYINGLFTPKAQVDIVVDQSTYQPAPVPEIKFRKQVFNIPGNYYNYENAKALCSAYGADLANYQQVEDAYRNGAEWCNYGWSADQLALFPTQQKTYDHLQTIPDHKNDCGRPGINGGYIANQNVKFGVNCYGYKPKITEEEDTLMKTSPPYPETAQDIALQKRVDFWKGKVDDILVSPFNHNRWSEL
jgi:Extracellular link domain